jgi:hypothetical protein
MFENDSDKSNLAHEESKKRINLGTACYVSFRNILTSSLLSKNVKNGGNTQKR